MKSSNPGKIHLDLNYLWPQSLPSEVFFIKPVCTSYFPGVQQNTWDPPKNREGLFLHRSLGPIAPGSVREKYIIAGVKW